MAASTVTFSFDNQVVIVTGGNSGIGAATVQEFLTAGAKVAIFDIRPAQSDGSVKSNDDVFEIICDVSDEKAAEDAIAEVVKKWGSIDILCNVAGVMDAMDRVSECETSTWERCFKVNVNGPFFLTRACTKLWLDKPKTEPVSTRGQIVNVCSAAGKGAAYAGVAYTASKHAALGLTKSTAWMYAKEGIRCNAVLPGGVRTNIVQNSGHMEKMMTAPGMMAIQGVHALMPGETQAVDVARAILLVAANEGMNGVELAIDGGWTTI